MADVVVGTSDVRETAEGTDTARVRNRRACQLWTWRPARTRGQDDDVRAAATAAVRAAVPATPSLR